MIGKYWIYLAICALLSAGCSGGKERQQRYMDRAIEYMAAEDYGKASLDIRNALQIDGDDADARYLYARILEKQRNWPQMIANLRLVIELDPTHLPARIDYGTRLLASQLYEEAQLQADAAVTAHPDNHDAHALLASVQLANGDVVTATQSALHSLKLQPGNVGATAVLTKIYQADEPELALDIIRKSISEQTDDAALKLLEISVHRSQGNTVAVRETYDQLLEEHPENLFYHFLYVRYLNELNRNDEAVTVLSRAVQARPRQVELKLWMAQNLLDHGNAEQAKIVLQQYSEESAGEERVDMQLALARVLVQQDEIAPARAVYHGLLSDDMESAQKLRVRNALVQLEIVQGNQPEADALLDEILSADAENADALLTKARLSMATGDQERAITSLRTVLRNDPDNAIGLEWLAEALLATGATSLGIDRYRQLLQLRPHNINALLGLSNWSLQEGDPEQARKLAQAALNWQPDNLDAVRQLVAANAEAGDWQAAKALTDQLQGQPESKALADYLNCKIFHKQGRLSQAIEACKAALKTQPDIVEALAVLAESSIGMGEGDSIRNYLEAHVVQFPNHHHAYGILAAVQDRYSDPETAIETLRRAVNRHPNEYQHFVNLGDYLKDLGKLTDAESVYAEGIAQNPKAPLLWIARGMVEELTGRFEEAVVSYEQALQLSDSLVAKNNLAMIYADKLPTEENLYKALNLIRAYGSDASPAILDTIGWVYFKLGEYGQATRYLQRAIEVGGKEPSIQYHLARAFVAQRRVGDAAQALAVALSSPSDFPERKAAEQLQNELPKLTTQPQGATGQ